MTDNRRFFADFQKRVHRTHVETPGAIAPPDDLWRHILAQVQPAIHEEEIMNSPAFASPATGQLAGLTQPAGKKRGFGHYANVAATLAIIVAIAVAGWFAAMQLNPQGEPEPRLAMISATPGAEATPPIESGMCDVEPLSTDTVMEIVKNPARFTANGPTGEPSDRPMVGSPTNAELWEVDPDLELVGASMAPREEQFDDASQFANAYLNCLLYGTQGQIWTFYSPVLLQQKILGEFPVFAEEAQVRERVEELATQPAYEAEYAWVEVLSVRTGSEPVESFSPPEMEFDQSIDSVSVNPDYQLARSHQSESSYYEYVLSIGISIQDVDGNQTLLTNGVGNSIIPVDPFGSGINPPMIYVQVAKLRHSEGWVIIPWPSVSEMGWDQY